MTKNATKKYLKKPETIRTLKIIIKSTILIYNSIYSIFLTINIAFYVSFGTNSIQLKKVTNTITVFGKNLATIVQNIMY